MHIDIGHSCHYPHIENNIAPAQEGYYLISLGRVRTSYTNANAVISAGKLTCRQFSDRQVSFSS